MSSQVCIDAALDVEETAKTKKKKVIYRANKLRCVDLLLLIGIAFALLKLSTVGAELGSYNAYRLRQGTN